MEGITDIQLIDELKARLEAKNRAFSDLERLARRLEDVNGKLIESEKLKSNFLSNIRNEINNPLTVILSMCELILTDGADLDKDTLIKTVRTVHRESFSLDFQLRNIFAAAELEAGESAPSITAVDVGSLVRSVSDGFRNRAMDKGLGVEVRIAQDLDGAPFMTDHDKLERVVANLLANAIEYSGDGGRVEVSVTRIGKKLAISVADMGVGIDVKHHEIIFERFRQLDTGVTKPHPGHGLGLSITKEVLRLLDGTVNVESEKGAGSCFTVTLREAAETSDGDVMSIDGADFFFDDEEGFLKL